MNGSAVLKVSVVLKWEVYESGELEPASVLI